MVGLIPSVQCALRIILASILGHTVALHIFTNDPALIGAFAVTMPGLATSLFCVTLSSIGIWLILGVATRTVALVGFALYFAHDFVLPSHDALAHMPTLGSALVALLALPLIIFGGGRFSVNAVLLPEAA